MPVIDYLSCPACGCPITNGVPCNLTCRRQVAEQQQSEAPNRLPSYTHRCAVLWALALAKETYVSQSGTFVYKMPSRDCLISKARLGESDDGKA